MSWTRDSRPEAQTETADGAPPSPSAQPAGAVPYAPAGTAGRGCGASRPATKRHRLGPKPMQVDAEKMREMREAGATLAQIAKALDVSPWLVAERLKQMGVKPPKTMRRGGKPAQHVDEAALRAAYAMPLTVAQIADKLGVTEHPVRKMIRRLGLTRPPVIPQTRKRKRAEPQAPPPPPPGPAQAVVATDAFRARVQERRAAGEQWVTPETEAEARLCIAVMLGEAGLDRLMGAAA